jgi:hypothetical protein
MTTTVEYPQYVNTREKLDKFYNAFINTDNKKSQKYIPFLEKSFKHYIHNRNNDNSIVDESNLITLLSVNNFAELQSQALRGNMRHSQLSISNNSSQSNSNSSSTGFLNFTKRDNDRGYTKPNSTADKYIIFLSEKRKNLIYTSIEIIEIFISILEAYKNFITESQVKNISINNITDIFIVSQNVKKLQDRTQDNMSVYVKKSIGSGDPGHIFPLENTLFLIIKSFNNDIMQDDDTTTDDDKYNNFYKKSFSFNDSRKAEVVQSTVSNEDRLFSPDETILNKNTVFSGIKISKSEDGHSILYNNETNNINDYSNLSTITNSDIKHSTNKQLCSVVLKNFLYYLHEIEAVNLNFQVNALLYYYKIMKCYLLNSVYAGNYLFNTKFINGKTDTPTELSSVIAIYPIINNTTKITDTFLNTVDTQNDWDNLIQKNNIINNTLDKLTKEIDDNIQGNNVSNNSIIHPIIYQGFYVKKISDTVIELSPIISPIVDGEPSVRSFPNYLQQFNSSVSNHLQLFNSSGKKNPGLSIEEDHLANIIGQDSEHNINKDIIKEYQIEINNNLYTIEQIFTGTSNGIKSISRIHILAKFEYTNVNDSTNTSKIFKFERNTYDVFNGNDNILQENIVNRKQDTRATFNLDGKVKNTNVIDDKYILLYNYKGAHPNVNNNVIFNKNVNLKKTYNEDMDKIKKINKKIIYNETKINNSGRLYDIQDNEYSILYNQLMIYYVVIAVLCCIVIIVNYANIGSDLIINATTGCFITIIMLIISFYLVDIAYIEKYVNVENFNIEHFNTTASFQSTSGLNETENINIKVSNIQAIMNSYESKISRIIDILMVSIPQVEFLETNKILNKIVENEKNDKMYVNKGLDHKRINSYNFIDVKKYDIVALKTLTKTVLAVAFVIFGFYTLHFYVSNRLNDTLIFICAIFLIIIFAYYIIYANRVVRTVSTNVYWGKEFEENYDK